WLAAYDAASVDVEKPLPARKAAAAAPKAKKLSYKERQEWDGMEAALLTAEAAVAEKQAAVERAATAGHAALTAACHDLEAAQHAVERLFARWQELEVKRGG
ncbi:MAG: ABC transporter ATP-binding protein, partial [Gemmataceae bacterium]|nr:ABC transporter ATP-binding protein [Gemmataceae bacterium]